MKEPGSEHDDQCALFAWAAMQENVYPALRMMFAIPNGGYRAKRTAVKLREEGVKPGVPDIFLAFPNGHYSGLFVELKHGRNTASDKQAEWLEALNSMGYCAALAWGFEDAKQLIINYLEGRL